MFSVLGTAWRVVVKRAAADWLILGAALITIVLATTLLAAGPIYAEAVTLSGAQRTLANAAVDDVNVEVSLRVPPEKYAGSDAKVAAVVPEVFSLTGGVIEQRLVSESYELPEQASDEFTDVAVFQYLSRIDEHATIVTGGWPQPGGEPHQVAIPEATAALLDLGVGDEMTVTSRSDRSRGASIAVVGLFRFDRATDPYWYGDELVVGGVASGAAFRTFGPFVVDAATLLNNFAASNAEANWRVFPDFDNLEIGELAAMRRQVQSLESRLNAGQEIGLVFGVDTRLDRILIDTERSLLATRSGVLTLTVQLAILAGYALLLTAGLLVESRRVETGLLRSRGASSRQILTMAVMEGAILTLPAALAAPWLAATALGAFNDLGPLATISLRIEPAVIPASFVLSFVAATGCILALALPAYRSARTFSESYVARGREQTRGFVQRGGVDFALLALAGIALWQLRRYGGPITATVQGRLGIDPLLVAAPTLGLLAGAVLALRTIPLLARVAERIATAGSSAVRALAAWQVARRPVRHSRSALLLIMAITVGLLAAAYTTTWKRSQEDQADYQTGADLRVLPNRRINASIPDLNLQDAHQRLAEVEASMPVVRSTAELTRTAGTGRFVMLDAVQAPTVVRIRDDLAAPSFAAMMAELVSGRPPVASVPVPGAPQRLALDIAIELEPLPEDLILPAGVPESRVGFDPTVTVVLQDGAGLLHRVDAGAVPVDAGPARLAVDLTYALADGTVATPTYPVAIVAVELRVLAPLLIPRLASIEVRGLFTAADAAAPWQEIEAGLNSQNWTLEKTALPFAFNAPSATFAAGQPERGVAFELSTGVATTQVPLPVHFGLRPTGESMPDTFPVVVSAGFLEATGAGIGDEVELSAIDTATAVIAGAVANLPTVPPEFGEAILIDLPTAQALSYATGEAPAPITERWLRVAPGQASAVGGALLAPPYDSVRVMDRLERAETLKADPVALGTIGSLSLGFAAAAVFAAVGFAVSAVVSARERITEFALLRAVGLSTPQLARWLALEHGVLVVVSLLLGSLIGLGLSWLVLPLIAITQDASAAVPEVIVVYPWDSIIRLEVFVVAILGLIVVGLAVVLRRLGLGALLRLGED